MAFSKAKLFRFNDIQSCAPPPGAYNPKFGDHVSGALVYVQGKPVDIARSPASSCSEVNSCSSVPNFRTPTVPRRKKLLLPNSAGKKITSTNLFSPQKSEALRDKIVECVNKDETIKDLENQIEELKLCVCNLKVEKEHLKTERDDVANKLVKVQQELEDINNRYAQIEKKNRTMSEDFLNMKAQLHAENTAQLKELQRNMLLLEERLKESMKECGRQIEEVEGKLESKVSECVSLKQNLVKTREEISVLELKRDELLKRLEETEKKHAHEMESAKEAHREEVEGLQGRLLEEMTNWKRVVENTEADCKKKVEEMREQQQLEIHKMKSYYEAQLQQNREEMRQLEENCSEKIKLAEMQLEETRKDVERNYELKLLEQERKSTEILQYSIIQTEIEKNGIKQKLLETEELVKSIKIENSHILKENAELQLSLASLKTDMSKIIIELNDARDKLGREIQLRQKDLEAALAEKHCYEITLNKTYETVNALKNRLLHSDRDVEQLTEELKHLEVSKLESETKCVLVNEELQHVLKISEELKTENVMLAKIEQKTASLKKELLKKVDNLKKKADEKISELNKVIAEKQNALDELHLYIRDQQKLHGEAQFLVTNAKEEIEHLESEATDYKTKIAQLESALERIKNELAQLVESVDFKNQQVESLKGVLKEKELELNEMTSIYKKYIERSKQFDELQQKYEELVKNCKALEKIIDDQNALIGPFRDQLENYERECKLLMAHKDEAEKEAKEMGLKYAEILGHQNYKQKLKHMVDLKKTNINLKKEKHEYELKIMQQQRIIENLKQELSHLSCGRKSTKANSSTDKENLCSPVRSAINNSRTDSPGNPLKERN